MEEKLFLLPFDGFNIIASLTYKHAHTRDVLAYVHRHQHMFSSSTQLILEKELAHTMQTNTGEIDREGERSSEQASELERESSHSVTMTYNELPRSNRTVIRDDS